MLLKSQELNLKKKDFSKGKIVLLYGENQDLIKDLPVAADTLSAVFNAS